MSVLGLFAVSCDRCGEQSAPATDLSSARVVATTAGWSLVRTNGRVFDYCPQHAGRAPAHPLVVTTTTTVWSCAECSAGLHGECSGWAWDFDKDEKTQCQCTDCGPAQMTQSEFDALLDYSASLPTGTTIGKQWKRRNDYHDESKGWMLGEYVEHPNPDLVGIRWRQIEIVAAASSGAGS